MSPKLSLGPQTLKGRGLGLTLSPNIDETCTYHTRCRFSLVKMLELDRIDFDDVEKISLVI